MANATHPHPVRIDPVGVCQLLDIVFIGGAIALFAIVALVAWAVERL
ncbi:MULTISPECIES: hypothetical protein [unclassified Plantibacter]